eukprot:TRINITY_DN6043_c0_g1_i1.p4 TRINITY_DN6043_c0_g1~~TRINITY_DN6043_c0_g1_i1.p4  ORF type:complete len:133 (-),score=3.42 TRINITY_DN6043_c0_g1_i1:173-571(-)
MTLCVGIWMLKQGGYDFVFKLNKIQGSSREMKLKMKVVLDQHQRSQRIKFFSDVIAFFITNQTILQTITINYIYWYVGFTPLFVYIFCLFWFFRGKKLLIVANSVEQIFECMKQLWGGENISPVFPLNPSLY